MSTNKDWTVMVYLAGDNDLPTYCISILQQLEAVKYPDNVCVLACFDSSVPWSAGLRYFRINCRHRQGHHEFDWEIHNDLVVPKKRRQVTVNADMGQYDGSTNDKLFRPVVSEGLRRFVNWSLKHHPDSDRYMLILFGHGLAVNGQNFLISENPRSFLRVQDLQEIITEQFGPKGVNKKLNILALQNCVMNGVEMAYALRDHTELMIGSQDLVLASGWPYQGVINSVIDDTGAAIPDIARKMLQACGRHMLDFAIMDRSSEQSVIDLKALRDASFVEAVSNLAKALIDGLRYDIRKDKVVSKDSAGQEVTVKTERRELAYPAICDATRLARLEAQAFWHENYVDLFDFCERLIKKCNEVVIAQSKLLKELKLEEDPQPNLRNSPLVATAKRIIDCCRAILKREKVLVPLSYQIGPDLQYSRGLSVYFPWTRYGAELVPTPMRGGKKFSLKPTFDVYKDYEFVIKSGWSDFLHAFFLATLRNVRRNDREFHDIADGESLEFGLVGETYTPQNDVKTGDLMRTSPDTARTSPDTSDYDNSVNIKNYPRRGYLSPVDWPRKIVDARSFTKGTPNFEPTSIPVSAVGWNVVGLLAETIEKKSTNGNRHQNRGPKAVEEVNEDGRSKMEPAIPAEPLDASKRVGPNA
ncbi:MAG TPA: clostripain-related cysteine peptidase [Candidatus Saccharimonadales bacterium]|nr:clostripain-related cysteine peptidase [Candidatus Saccharimonadales bacterium]